MAVSFVLKNGATPCTWFNNPFGLRGIILWEAILIGLIISDLIMALLQFRESVKFATILFKRKKQDPEQRVGVGV